MDEYQKYYTKRLNGTFLVHFPNFYGLTNSEIIEQFAQYGKVVSVDTRGKVNGLCFVTYEKEEDVIRCLQGLKYNKSIRILKHKSQNKSEDQKNATQRQESDTQGSVKSNSNFENKEDTMKKEHRDKGLQSRHQIPQDTLKSVGKSDNKVLNPNAESKFPRKGKVDFKLKKKFVESKIKSLSQGNLKSNVKPQKKVSPKMSIGVPPALMSMDTGAIVKKGMEKEQSSVRTNSGSKTNSVSEDSYIHESTFEDEEVEFGLCFPPCLLSDFTMEAIRGIASSPSPSIKSNRNIDTQIKTDSDKCFAQEIIVANIDDTYGIHYILHLFEKFNPIAASMMKTTTNSKIRYCHIYVTSWKAALAIQEEFDGYSLDEKNLIVLTSQNLIREALTA